MRETYTLDIPCEPFERAMFDVTENQMVPCRITGYRVRVFKGDGPPMATPLIDDLTVLVGMISVPVEKAA